MTTVSEIGHRRQRRRRSDADRSAGAVLDAAVRVLGQHPEASVGRIAEAAGVTRQTVYAHYPSRQALREAVVDRITDEVIAALEAADVESGRATAALERWLDASWRLIERYPLLLHPSLAIADPHESYQRHLPVFERLGRLIERGRATGEFDRTLPAAWLLAAIMALGHAAGDEVTAGRMSAAAAGAALRDSVLRLCTASGSSSDR